MSSKYYTNGTTEMIIPDGSTIPVGFYLANNTSSGSPTVVPFWDGNSVIVPISINALVPSGYAPLSTRTDIKYTYRVYDAPNLNYEVIYVTGNAVPTSKTNWPSDNIGNVYLIGFSSVNGFGVLAETYIPSTEVRSTGTYYTDPISGTSTYISAGATVPPGWVLTASIPIDTVVTQNGGSTPVTRQTNKHKAGGPVTSGTQTNDVPVGYETYSLPNGKYIVVPAGLQHPASWVLLNTGAGGGSNNQTDVGANVSPWGIEDLVPMPVAPPDTNAGIGLGTILALLGLGGIIYIGYMFWFHPNSVRAAVKAFDEFKVLFVDASQLLIALATIAALSFVSYEFWAAYQDTGSIAGALGQLAANIIETFALAFVDALEQLLKDAWNAIVKDIKSILPSWL